MVTATAYQVHDRLVATAVTELKLFHLGAAGQADHLVTKTNTKDRHLADQLLHLLVGLHHGVGVAGAIGQKDAVGIHVEHAADGDLRVWVRRGIAPVVMNERFGRIRLTHVNLNDGTAEGIQLLDAPCFSVQYHPEASPGPTDAHYLFTAFTRLMDGEENYLDIDTAKDRLAGWNFAETAATETEEN